MDYLSIHNKINNYDEINNYDDDINYDLNNNLIEIETYFKLWEKEEKYNNDTKSIILYIDYGQLYLYYSIIALIYNWYIIIHIYKFIKYNNIYLITI